MWQTVPLLSRSKDISVKTTRSTVTVRLKFEGGSAAHTQTLRRPIQPDETIWEFDDDEDNKDQRRIRLDLVLCELESLPDGPFLPN